MGAELERLHQRWGTSSVLPSFVQDSWIRCLDSFHITPDTKRRPAILTHRELRDAVGNSGDFVRSAQPEVDRLFRRLMRGEFLVSLAAPDGVKLLFRSDPAIMDDLTEAGVVPGSIWTEETEGTNGIGTGLRLGRPLIIQGDQHFHVSLKALTCTVAPVQGPHGQVAGILNVTSLYSETARTAHLLSDIVSRSALRIEGQLFRRHHHAMRLVTLSREGDFGDPAAVGLAAIDDAGHIVDVTSTAPQLLGMMRDRLLGQSVTEVIQPGEVLAHPGSKPNDPTLPRPPGIFARWEAPTHNAPKPRRIVNPDTQGRFLTDPRQDQILTRAVQLLQRGQPLVIEGEAGVGKTSFVHRLLVEIAASRSPCLLDGLTEAQASLTALPQLSTGHLVIDHIADLTTPVQSALLAALDDDSALLTITVTTEPLETLAITGRLRSDLAQRLSGTTLQLPSLRSAPALPQIVQSLFQHEASDVGRAGLALSAEALAALCSHYWPGNFRELRKALRQAAILAPDQVEITDLPEAIFQQSLGHDLRSRTEQEAARIESALRHNHGNVAETARLLGISRATLYRKIQISKLRRK